MNRNRILITAAALLAAGAAIAQTAAVRWELRVKGGTEPLGTYTTQTACDTAARARNLTAVYECPRLLAVTASAPPVVCPAARAPRTETPTGIQCPAGTTGTVTQVTTYTMGPPPACVETGTTAAPVFNCTANPPPPTGLTYYFSDCQPGAAAGCTPGSNANPGTQAAPKQNLAGFNHNALPAGSTLRFNRGGAWPPATLELNNPNTTAAAPLVIEAYGTGPAPWLVAPTCANGVNVGGRWNNTDNDGGYVLLNLKIAPAVACTGTADHYGVWFVQNVRDVRIENTEITGFRIGVNSNYGAPHGVRGVTLLNNNIHHNRAMGLLGKYDNLLLEGNTIEANNFGGSNFDHGTYIGGGSNLTLRGNRYIRNSAVNGTCTGGNMTFHGQIDGLVIEDNEIVQDAGAPTCYLISITRGYSTAEWFRNAVVRNNRLSNGGSGIVAQSAPGIVVEGNVLINTNASIGTGSTPPSSTGGDAGDLPDTNAVVRNNTICRRAGNAGFTVNSPGGTVVGNLVRTDAEATTGVCAP